jgi:16S rRNA (uracil1498-N3)-methyltransferase
MIPTHPVRRLFVPAIEKRESNIVLEGPAKRHVRDVLRMGPGDSLLLFDGSGVEYLSTIIEAGSRNVTLRILRTQPGGGESPVSIRVGMALLKASKMDLVIQKLSELGVQQVCPVAVCRSVPDLDPKRAERRRVRWQTIAQEASRQSGRSGVAEIRPVLSLENMLRQSEDADLSLLFSTSPTARPMGALSTENIRRPERVVMLIGPEGGFSPEEERSAQKKGFLPVGLGPRVLRAETAAILAVGLVQYLFGDLGGSMENVSSHDA